MEFRTLPPRHLSMNGNITEADSADRGTLKSPQVLHQIKETIASHRSTRLPASSYKVHGVRAQDDERARKLIESKLAESKLGSGGSAADKRAALKQQRMGGAGGRVRSNSGNNGVSGVTSGSGKDDVSAAGAGITSRNAGLGSHAMLPGKEIADGGSGRDGGAAGKSADLHAHLDNNQVHPVHSDIAFCES